MTSQQACILDVEAAEVSRGLIEQIEARTPQPAADQIEDAVRIIGKHLRKEASNRQLDMIGPDDLCPAQKRDMVRDLMRLLREQRSRDS